MTVETKNWTQKQRERFEAAGLPDELIKIAKGEIEVSQTRLRAIEIALNKTMPNLRQVELQGQIDSDVTISWKS